MKRLLVDTGPLVAYLNSRDSAHETVSTLFQGFSGQLDTTGAVITEAMHFVAAVPRGPEVLAEFVVSSGMRVHDFSQPPNLRTAAALMAKYSDIPMDYADATLVLLGEHLAVLDILTLDRRGFTIFRTRQRRAFRILER